MGAWSRRLSPKQDFGIGLRGVTGAVGVTRSAAALAPRYIRWIAGSLSMELTARSLLLLAVARRSACTHRAPVPVPSRTAAGRLAFLGCIEVTPYGSCINRTYTAGGFPAAGTHRHLSHFCGLPISIPLRAAAGLGTFSLGVHVIPDGSGLHPFRAPPDARPKSMTIVTAIRTLDTMPQPRLKNSFHMFAPY